MKPEEGQKAVELRLPVTWRAGGKVYIGTIRNLSDKDKAAWFEGQDGKGESISGRPPLGELALVGQE